MLLDTNILIALFNDNQKITEQITDLSYQARSFYISSISITEILALSVLSDQEITETKLFLINFISVPFDDDIAELAASIIRKYQLKLPDASIVSSALLLDVPLVTQDKQLHKVKELEIILI